eukprot:GHVT01068039.1.p1 GENE.GHVT01068039.1~~GHVT01068039.1.p1  ORF type:complete len:326 (+),score=60.14 GHVT01068039.1:654-1631(+)
MPGAQASLFFSAATAVVLRATAPLLLFLLLSLLAQRALAANHAVPHVMGEDSHGGRYGSVRALWQQQLGKNEERKGAWYAKAEAYWARKEASINGVLDGFEAVHSVDLAASEKFMLEAKKKLAALAPPVLMKFNYALDCGAGIGRVTKGFLLKLFDKVDLVEPIEKYVEVAKQTLPRDRVIEFFKASLQDFTPPSKRYDCIWVQWCILYLTDSDLVAFLVRCRDSFAPNSGMVVVKENVVLDNTSGFQVDKEDNSIMRTDYHYRLLFSQAGFDVAFDMKQPNFPQNVYPVYMYCLVPKQARPETRATCDLPPPLGSGAGVCNRSH